MGRLVKEDESIVSAITIDLQPEQLAKLRSIAERLGISVENLARTRIEELVKAEGQLEESVDQTWDGRLDPQLQTSNILAKRGTDEFVELYWKRKAAIKQMKELDDRNDPLGNPYLGSRPVQHQKYRSAK